MFKKMVNAAACGNGDIGGWASVAIRVGQDHRALNIIFSDIRHAHRDQSITRIIKPEVLSAVYSRALPCCGAVIEEWWVWVRPCETNPRVRKKARCLLSSLVSTIVTNIM